MSRDEKQFTITVGYDGSTSGRAALLWAVAEAQARGAVLQVMVAAQPAVPPWALPPSHDWTIMGVRRAEEVAREAKEIAGGQAPVMTAVDEGLPGRVLGHYSQASDLLVVGSSGHVGVAGWARGSVSRYLLHHASCPLVVVGPESFPGRVKRLVLSANLDPDGDVVGLTGGWVQTHQVPVHVVGSYALPTLMPDITLAFSVDLAELHARVGEQFSAYVDSVRLALPAGTTISSELKHGLVAEVLDREIRLGDLLVVPRGCEHDVPFAHGRCPVCVV
jgi:nucleotide-binding universal stress UspA family protein